MPTPELSNRLGARGFWGGVVCDGRRWPDRLSSEVAIWLHTQEGTRTSGRPPKREHLGVWGGGEHVIVLGASGQGGGRWGRQTPAAASPLAQGFSWGKSLPLLASVSSSAK